MVLFHFVWVINKGKRHQACPERHWGSSLYESSFEGICRSQTARMYWVRLCQRIQDRTNIGTEAEVVETRS